MARAMPSEELQLLIAGYVLGDLDPAEAVEFERLLAVDPTIAEELAQMQAALELPYAPPEIAPPAHLRAAVLDAIDSQAPIPDAHQTANQTVTPLPTASPASRPASRPASTPTRRFSWNRAWGAAAAVLIAALGINNYRLWQTLQTTQTEVRPSDALTYTLQGIEPSSTAVATLVVDPGTLDAALTVNNLPPPPPGKTYVLWTVLKPNAPFTADRKNAVLTEILTPSAEGSLVETIAVPDLYRSSQYVAKVAITLEDTATPQAHAGDPILITGL